MGGLSLFLTRTTGTSSCRTARYRTDSNQQAGLGERQDLGSTVPLFERFRQPFGFHVSIFFIAFAIESKSWIYSKRHFEAQSHTVDPCLPQMFDFSRQPGLGFMEATVAPLRVLCGPMHEACRIPRHTRMTPWSVFSFVGDSGVIVSCHIKDSECSVAQTFRAPDGFVSEMWHA
ncbi:hypothetical protein VTK26DRAFT_7824 [Humicola hyalothermophila]